MKVVIPVAGEGRRLRPHTHTTPKVLIEVAGKPILGYILDELLRLEIEEAIFIVGYMGDKVQEYVQSQYPLNASFIHQSVPRGLGHAVYLARERVEEGELLIVLGDTVFEADLGELVSKPVAKIGVWEVEDPRRFGVVEFDDGRVIRLVEKPEMPPSNMIIVGPYYVPNSERLFEALERNIASDRTTRGEIQLTDALQLMIEEGERMEVFRITGWFDCGQLETVLATNRHLLDKYGGCPELEGSIIHPPVFVDPSAVVESSIIGPYVSIAEEVTIKESVIRDSIINSGAFVENVLIHQSLLGDYAIVRGALKKLNVGDSSEIDFE
jgi:glucose-1-phosphate thymidylyltransferase